MENLLDLGSAATFTLAFWSCDGIYMLSRIEKNWQVVWREGIVIMRLHQMLLNANPALTLFIVRSIIYCSTSYL